METLEGTERKEGLTIEREEHRKTNTISPIFFPAFLPCTCIPRKLNNVCPLKNVCPLNNVCPLYVYIYIYMCVCMYIYIYVYV